jgi:hypothetical protein
MHAPMSQPPAPVPAPVSVPPPDPPVKLKRGMSTQTVRNVSGTAKTVSVDKPPRPRAIVTEGLPSDYSFKDVVPIGYRPGVAFTPSPRSLASSSQEISPSSQSAYFPRIALASASTTPSPDTINGRESKMFFPEHEKPPLQRQRGVDRKEMGRLDNNKHAENIDHEGKSNSTNIPQQPSSSATPREDPESVDGQVGLEGDPSTHQSAPTVDSTTIMHQLVHKSFPTQREQSERDDNLSAPQILPVHSQNHRDMPFDSYHRSKDSMHDQHAVVEDYHTFENREAVEIDYGNTNPHPYHDQSTYPHYTDPAHAVDGTSPVEKYYKHLQQPQTLSRQQPPPLSHYLGPRSSSGAISSVDAVYGHVYYNDTDSPRAEAVDGHHGDADMHGHSYTNPHSQPGSYPHPSYQYANGDGYSRPPLDAQGHHHTEYTSAEHSSKSYSSLSYLHETDGRYLPEAGNAELNGYYGGSDGYRRSADSYDQRQYASAGSQYPDSIYPNDSSYNRDKYVAGPSLYNAKNIDQYDYSPQYPPPGNYSTGTTRIEVDHDHYLAQSQQDPSDYYDYDSAYQSSYSPNQYSLHSHRQANLYSSSSYTNSNIDNQRNQHGQPSHYVDQYGGQYNASNPYGDYAGGGYQGEGDYANYEVGEPAAPSPSTQVSWKEHIEVYSNRNTESESEAQTKEVLEEGDDKSTSTISTSGTNDTRKHLQIWERFFENAFAQQQYQQRLADRAADAASRAVDFSNALAKKFFTTAMSPLSSSDSNTIDINSLSPAEKARRSIEALEESWRVLVSASRYQSLLRLARSTSSAGTATSSKTRMIRQLTLFAAVVTNDLTNLQHLLHEGEDVDIRDSSSLRTLLHYASRYASNDIIGVLYDSDISIDHRDSFGHTALHVAVAFQRVQTIKFLLDCAVDTNVMNKFGLTALDLAKLLNREGCVKIIEGHRAESIDSKGASSASRTETADDGHGIAGNNTQASSTYTNIPTSVVKESDGTEDMLRDLKKRYKVGVSGSSNTASATGISANKPVSTNTNAANTNDSSAAAAASDDEMLSPSAVRMRKLSKANSSRDNGRVTDRNVASNVLPPPISLPPPSTPFPTYNSNSANATTPPVTPPGEAEEDLEDDNIDSSAADEDEPSLASLLSDRLADYIWSFTGWLIKLTLTLLLGESSRLVQRGQRARNTPSKTNAEESNNNIDNRNRREKGEHSYFVYDTSFITSKWSLDLLPPPPSSSFVSSHAPPPTDSELQRRSVGNSSTNSASTSASAPSTPIASSAAASNNTSGSSAGNIQVPEDVQRALAMARAASQNQYSLGSNIQSPGTKWRYVAYQPDNL